MKTFRQAGVRHRTAACQALPPAATAPDGTAHGRHFHPETAERGDIHRKYLFKYKRPERGAEEPNWGGKMRNDGIICFLTILLNL